MSRFGIRLSAYTTEIPCSLCGKPAAHAAGLQICLAGNSAAVCQDCSRVRAPRLAKLVQLAQVAERVGKISRYNVAPPLAALLDLAGAAEAYASAAREPSRRDQRETSPVSHASEKRVASSLHTSEKR